METMQGRERLLRAEQNLLRREANAAHQQQRVRKRIDEAVAGVAEAEAAQVRVALDQRPGDLVTLKQYADARRALHEADTRLVSIDRAAEKAARVNSERPALVAVGRKVMWLLDNWRLLGSNEKRILATLPIARAEFHKWHPDGLPPEEEALFYAKATEHLCTELRHVNRIHADAGGGQ